MRKSIANQWTLPLEENQTDVLLAMYPRLLEIHGLEANWNIQMPGMLEGLIMATMDLQTAYLRAKDTFHIPRITDTTERDIPGYLRIDMERFLQKRPKYTASAEIALERIRKNEFSDSDVILQIHADEKHQELAIACLRFVHALTFQRIGHELEYVLKCGHKYSDKRLREIVLD